MVELTEEEALKIANDIKAWLLEDGDRENPKIYIGRYTTTHSIQKEPFNIACKQFPSVKLIMVECSEIQKYKIIDYATRRPGNHKFAEFMLINYYGFKSGSESKKSQSKEKSTKSTKEELSDTELDKQLSELEKKISGDPSTEPPD